MKRIRILCILAKIVIIAFNLVDEKIRDIVFELKSLGTFDGDYDRLRRALTDSILS